MKHPAALALVFPLLVLLAGCGGSDSAAKLEDEATPTPASQRSAQHTGSDVKLVGVVQRRDNNGIFIYCRRGDQQANAGHDQEELTGAFLVTGYPSTAKVTDGATVEFRGRQAGMHQYTDAEGKMQTVRRVAYAGPSGQPVSGSAASPKPKGAFGGNSSLDRPAYK